MERSVSDQGTYVSHPHLYIIFKIITEKASNISILL